MAFDAFRRYLTSEHRSVTTGQPFGPSAATDYVSRLRRLEKIFESPLENAAPMLLRTLSQDLGHDPRVIAAGVGRNVVGDIAVALRGYAHFLELLAERAVQEEGAATHKFLNADLISSELNGLGFVARHTRSQAVTELRRQDMIFYLDSGFRERPLVIHPLFEKIYSTISHLPGIICGRRLDFYHSPYFSNFPERRPSRSMRFGIAFGFKNESVFLSLLHELENALTFASSTDPEKTLHQEMHERETEKTLLSKARIGQGRFRADLLHFWQGHCALTDVSAPELLRASHIKAWRDSSNNERLDAFNGLLLAVHLDALFDRFLISFGEAGDMLISKKLLATERDVFGLREPTKILLTPRHLEYMHHHREQFYLGER